MTHASGLEFSDEEKKDGKTVKNEMDIGGSRKRRTGGVLVGCGGGWGGVGGVGVGGGCVLGWGFYPHTHNSVASFTQSCVYAFDPYLS